MGNPHAEVTERDLCVYKIRHVRCVVVVVAGASVFLQRYSGAGICAIIAAMCWLTS